ncbi:MAG: formyltetrahydrofolate deformylase [Deltaproteobacteria bacterium]|nr:MAG: formyltetrahydrofolate deformylase [Deltaproteobacteria bacterium]
MSKKLARIRVAGPDHKGVIAAVTSHLSQTNLNIEDIDQRILEGFLVMNMIVDISDLKKSLPDFRKNLQTVGKKIQMEITLETLEHRKIKHVALLVTKEDHCLKALLKDMKSGKIKGKPVTILSNQPDLEKIAKQHRIPFYSFPSQNKKAHEDFLISKIAEAETDLIVLARYMQILSPEFCFRHEGKIINIHPSLLPSFPGARAYAQAYNKGVEFVGVTAHFVTTDLDQGPIISQEAFRIDKSRETIESIMQKGKKAEAAALTRAVKLFCDDRLVLRRGKVIDSRHLNEVEQKAKEFYR